MAGPSSVRSLVGLTKRLKLSNPLPPFSNSTISRTINTSSPQAASAAVTAVTQDVSSTLPPVDSLSLDQLNKELRDIRLPRAVQATYLTPLRREAPHGDVVCDLQIRSYNVRNLEVFADFALRAAYYLNLPTRGPVPLPKITERWTVPRSSFIFKKSQENFERVTMRRLIQIQDGNPQTVQLWLSFLQKHRYYGIGMKANVFEHTSLEEAYSVDDAETPGMLKQEVDAQIEAGLDLIGAMKLDKNGADRIDLRDAIIDEQFKGGWGGSTAPMADIGLAKSSPGLNRRARLRVVRGSPRIIAAKTVVRSRRGAAESTEDSKDGKDGQ